ncbi:MAG: DUF4293 domain-containing protein [Alistipes sp.]|nr:DUF4293 domain-containing protein [Alistipes sp.]
MIQRIQTLYLLLVTALMAVTLFVPIATFHSGDVVYTLTAFSLAGGGESQSTLWMGIILVIATLLPFVTIFLFKKRQLQVRLCGAEMVVLLGAVAFIAIYYWLASSNALADVAIDHKQFGWAAPMPLVSLVLTYLAGRAIFKDELLVRSLDRIR